MAIGNLKQALEYAGMNPNSDFAKQLADHIKTGASDAEAKSLGIDLTPIKQSSIGVPTAPPAPQDRSVGEEIGQITVGAAKSIPATIKALSDVGEKIAGQTAGRFVNLLQGKGFTPTEATSPLENVLGKEKTKDITSPNTPGQKAGFVLGEIGQVLIPGTQVQKASEGLSFLPRVLTRAAGDVAITEGLTGNEGDAATAGAISTALQIAPYPVKFLGKIFKNLAGFASGRGSDVIEQIIKDPDAAQIGLRTNPTELLKKETENVITQTKNIKNASYENYSNAIKDIQDNYDELLKGFSVEKKDGLNVIKLRNGTSVIQDAGGNKFNLSISGLKSFITKAAKDFGATGSSREGLDFSNASLLPQEQSIVSKVVEKINNWTDITPIGINRLRQAVSGYARPGSGSMEKVNSIIYGLTNKIGEYLGERVPAVAQMNERFSTEQNFIDELQTYISSLGKVDKYGKFDPTEFKNVSNKIATLFNKNKEIAREVLGNMPGGSEILGTEAGRQLASDVPLTKAAIGGDISTLIQSIIPPKFIGEATVLISKLGNKAAPFMEALKKASPSERITLIQVVNELLSPEGN